MLWALLSICHSKKEIDKIDYYKIEIKIKNFIKNYYIFVTVKKKLIKLTIIKLR